MRCGARCGLREAGGPGAAAVEAPCTGKARLKAWGPQGTRGAHGKHADHVRDLGGVEAQRLVEGLHVLPSRKKGHACHAERAGRWEGLGQCGGASGMHVGEGPAQEASGARVRAERT